MYFPHWIRAVCGLSLLVLAACAPPTSLISAQKNSGPSPGLGRLNLVLGNGLGRDLLPPSYSSELANTYEVLLSDEMSLKTVSLTPGGDAWVDVLPGSYRVVVLAGHRRSDTSSVAQLLGSAYAEQLTTVNEGQTTTLSLVLHAVDFGWSAPDALAQGAQGRIEAHGSTANPYVGMSLSGTTTADRPRLKSVNLWGGYKDFPAPSGVPENWSCGLDLTGPAAAGTADLAFQGAAVVLVNAGLNSGTLTGKTKFAWKWLNRYDMADGGPLVPLVEKNVTLLPPATGLNVSLAWN
ncbi:MAG: hypothetical protein HKM06_00315 [Spirochaetales bacterium]|nr:hypothetical protein [Spirochaetales bacterium]